jgi:hypothetical protein
VCQSLRSCFNNTRRRGGANPVGGEGNPGWGGMNPGGACAIPGGGGTILAGDAGDSERRRRRGLSRFEGFGDLGEFFIGFGLARQPGPTNSDNQRQRATRSQWSFGKWPQRIGSPPSL